MYLEDGVMDIAPMIREIEEKMKDSIVVYDLHKRCVVVESNCDFREQICDPRILGFEVEE